MQFKGIMAIAGATTVLLAFEPTTLLAKVACGLLGGAAGAVVVDPRRKRSAN